MDSLFQKMIEHLREEADRLQKLQEAQVLRLPKQTRTLGGAIAAVKAVNGGNYVTLELKLRQHTGSPIEASWELYDAGSKNPGKRFEGPTLDAVVESALAAYVGPQPDTVALAEAVVDESTDETPREKAAEPHGF